MIKMAENYSKSIRKMIKRKRFKRFENSFENYFKNDSKLQKILKSIEFSKNLWKQLDDNNDIDDTFDDIDDKRHQSDFLGFGTPSAPPPESPPPTPPSANRIQELLQRQWAQRIRQLNEKRTEVRKNILRKAKFEINSKTLQKIRNQSQQRQLPVGKDASGRSGQPGFITCAICQTTKYYAHVQRRYGVFSCEPCSKFFARFLKEPKVFYCQRNGDCPIGANPSHNSSRVRPNVSGTRCRACWLKVCLQKFQMDSELRNSITNSFAPKLVTSLTPPLKMALITVDTSLTTPLTTATTQKTTKREEPLLMVASSGPRVKRVCRSAGIVSGLPVATFGSEKSSEDSDSLPIDVFLCHKVKKRRKGEKSA